MKIENITRKRKLIVGLGTSSLSLVLFRGPEVEASEKLLLRETPEESLLTSVTGFLKGRRPDETLLLLSRSEVLAKELALHPEGASLKESLEKILPYSPKEMAFGLSDGLLLALPEKRLKETLLFLERLGITPDEITTEDQALSWLLLEKGEKGPLLLLDQTEERILALFFSDRKILFSRTFPKKGAEEAAFFRDILEELSLALLERGGKPEKIVISATLSSEIEAAILKHFSLPLERLPLTLTLSPAGRGKGEGCLSGSFYGARLFGRYPFISLLPREAKIRKREKEKKGLVRGLAASFILFLGLVFFAFLIHLRGMEGEVKGLTHEHRVLTPDLTEVKKINASLDGLSRATASKEKILTLLKDLSSMMPAGVRLKELRIEGDEFSFKGESPSHGLLSETVEVLEKIDSINGARLHETRLRKRLNEDFFEFEVIGKWKV